MSKLLSPVDVQTFLDNLGNPLAGGKLYTYAAGTGLTVPAATYTDRAGLSANTNPILLNAKGEAILYLTAGQVYDYLLTDANDVPVRTRLGVDVDSDPLLREDLASTASGKGIAAIGFPAGSSPNQLTTGQHFAQNGAGIWRLNDRLLIGAASINDGAFPNTVRDWFSDFQVSTGLGNGTVVTSICAALSGTEPGAVVPFLGASRSLLFTSAGTTAIGLMGVVVNNNATYSTAAYAGYFEAHSVSATAGTTYGVEIDTRSTVSQQAATPFQQGSIHALQLASGAGVGGGYVVASISGTTMTVTSVSALLAGYTLGVGARVYGAGVTANTTISALGTGTGGAGTYTVNNAQSVTSRTLMITDQFRPSAAVYVTENPLPFQSGIVFSAKSIDGCDGVNGVGEAISFARGHYLRWYADGGVATSLLYSSATTLAGSVQVDMAEGQLTVANGSNGAKMMEVMNASTYVNFLRVQPAATTGAVVLEARGADTHVGLQLKPKGSADVQIPIANVRNFLNDAAAAAASPAVPVGGIYRNGSILMIRVT